MDQDTLITYILCYIICGTAMILNKDEPETKLEVLKLSAYCLFWPISVIVETSIFIYRKWTSLPDE